VRQRRRLPRYLAGSSVITPVADIEQVRETTAEAVRIIVALLAGIATASVYPSRLRSRQSVRSAPIVVESTNVPSDGPNEDIPADGRDRRSSPDHAHPAAERSPCSRSAGMS
jgi:hypothetical protein